MGRIALKLLFSTITRYILRFKSKQSIDMAGPCSILMDFDYTKAKLCKIRQFSLYFCLSLPAFCSRKTLLCSEKTPLCSGKTLLWCEKILLWCEKILLWCEKTLLLCEKTLLWCEKKIVYEKQLFFQMKNIAVRCENL